MKKKIATKLALAFSVCLFILWGILGAGSTLSWFVDSAPGIKNNFIVHYLSSLTKGASSKGFSRAYSQQLAS